MNDKMPTVPSSGSPSALDLSPGALVLAHGRECAVLMLRDMEEALVRDLGTGKTEKVRIQDLQMPEDRRRQTTSSEDLSLIPDEDWNIAQERMRIIRPLLVSGRTLTEVKVHAEKAKIHHTTLYRWIQRFEEEGKVSALLPIERSGGRGRSRLEPEVEEVLQKVLADVYLTRQAVTVTKAWGELKLRCELLKLPVPHINTVRSRIALLSDYLKLRRRVGGRAAAEAFSMDRGAFPGADYPLAVVQIDHTPMDVIIVDQEARKPIGRPWITVAIDVYSRMVLGYYISLDAPGSLSVGQCLAHAILPKEAWLARHEVDASWPCWGLPQVVHADNAREFRGKTLRRACEQYNVTLEFRPVKTPHYGGHIERLMGTVGKELHALPGTTFSSVHERGDYDSRGEAVFTFQELEQWVASFITGVYHQRPHAGLGGQAPIKRWEEGILGTKTRPGIGVPRRITDERRLKLDFLPYEERTIQQYGVALDGIKYFHDVLRPYIHAKDPADRKLKRKFTFRRDPRDISIIYFFDPNLKDYYPIPYRNTGLPPISVWELREAQRLLREQHKSEIDEALIFQTIRKMRSIQDSAQAITLKTRRKMARKKLHQERNLHAEVQITPKTARSDAPSSVSRASNGSEPKVGRVITPFEEIE